MEKEIMKLFCGYYYVIVSKFVEDDMKLFL